jgi:membrane protein
MSRPRTDNAPPEHEAIGVRGWWHVMGRTRYQLSNTNLSLLAAGTAFWALLAVVPTVIAIVTVWGMLASPTSVTSAVSKLGSSISPSTKQTLIHWMQQVVSAHQATLGVALIVSLASLIWSVSSSVSNLMTGVTAAYEQEETRGFVKRRGVAILLTVGAIMVAVVLIAAVSALPAVNNLIGTSSLRVLADVGVYAVVAAVLFGSIATLYRLGPSNHPADWAWASRGSKFSTVAVLITVIGFSFYVKFFSSYNKTYGALAGVVVFMLLIYYSIYVVLIGALLNSEKQREITGATDPRDYPEASPDNVRDDDSEDQRRPLEARSSR